MLFGIDPNDGLTSTQNVHVIPQSLSGGWSDLDKSNTCWSE